MRNGGILVISQIPPKAAKLGSSVGCTRLRIAGSSAIVRLKLEFAETKMKMDVTNVENGITKVALTVA